MIGLRQRLNAVAKRDRFSTGATPWGGFGAAPAINRLNEVFMENEIMAEGGFCYSEGIFEDINKMLMLSLYMGNNSKEETMRDYFRFYFGEDSVVYADEFLCCFVAKRPEIFNIATIGMLKQQIEPCRKLGILLI